MKEQMNSKSMKILTLITVLMFPFQLIIGQDSIVVSAQKTDLKTERRNQKIEERKAFVKKTCRFIKHL